ncbi:MAG: ATPase [Janthinobacterium lividum]
MLNELDSLSHNLNRLIEKVGADQARLQTLETELSDTRMQLDAVREELARAKAQGETLRSERDSLSAKIDEAQVKLNAILEKLPRSRPSDDQLDLLVTPSEQTTDDGETNDHH